ncbi:vacuolar import and degradation protein-domain-containing protein [Lactarius akahatsu]|uniref:Vacuolar import and degradation protein-domain-containing protein n=1 Tax=Lactarius akahatsu TaxID=416441 RepID=A0AAD4QFG4_9AGAM|nr:vacuolar import and degradation protein-domain-containing protein [Lactarius akahatsu]
MPVSPTSLPQQDVHAQPQVKLCSSCRSPLTQDLDATSPHFFSDSDINDLMMCYPCKERYLLQNIQQQAHELASYHDALDESHRLHQHTAHAVDGPVPLMESLSSVQLPPICPPSDRPLPSKVQHEALVPSAPSKRAKLAIVVSDGPRSAVSSTPSVPSSIRSDISPLQHSPAPDPYIDITRIRMRSQGHHCLYPGATFQGTQKSGRNSYDVTVSIVDVDFSSSFLCGYLCIRGLTDDWPELTTYFDAEIIGSRYGFLTRGWGADEDGDMVHWARFPAFRHVKNKLRPPHLTMDGYPGAVFMRWKERFLVPDHRVQDINGASFAGFYYVCVDFNSHAQSPTSPTRQQQTSSALIPDDRDAQRTHASATSKPDARGSSGHDDNGSLHRPSPTGTRSAPGVATMSGFYFHQNSEPYQQLSLQHVPETVSTSFELR